MAKGLILVLMGWRQAGKKKTSCENITQTVAGGAGKRMKEAILGLNPKGLAERLVADIIKHA